MVFKTLLRNKRNNQATSRNFIEKDNLKRKEHQQTTKQTIEGFIQKETQSHQVVIFAKSWCPYCDRTKNLFSSQPEFQNIDVKEYDLDVMSNGDEIQSELYKMTGQRTVPSVWVNGEFVGGNDDTQATYRMGFLSSMLAK